MEIYAIGKNIPTFAFANLLTEGEHCADTIDFFVDRFYEGNDISDCAFIISGYGDGTETSASLTKTVFEDKIRLRWNVSRFFTASAGTLKLEIKASRTENDTIVYVLKYIMPPVNVNPSPESDESDEE